MPDLYIVAAQPNPRGKDTSYPGHASNQMLNEEWVEFEAVRARDLTGDEMSHLTFNNTCQRTGRDTIMRFGAVSLQRGQRVRVHTGSGLNQWLGNTWHVYAGRSWFAWNNWCGDRAVLSYDGRVIDQAYYDPRPSEGVLVRQPGTDKLIPAVGRS